MISLILLIGLGGAIGAIARFGIHTALQSQMDDFPLGTFTVNVLGCFLLGALLAFSELRPALSANTRAFITVGILGSFTTFSTFGAETFELIRTKETTLALLSIGGNLFLGLLAVLAGRALIKAAL